MALTQLSLDLRNAIYRELLCPPQGIHLHDYRERCLREREEAELNGDYDDSNVDYDDSKGDYDDSDDDPDLNNYGGDKFNLVYSVTPIPIAILCTNRQLYAEVSQILYGSNRFTFSVAPKIAIRFLKRLPPALRSHIRHLSFTNRATAADDAGCTELWQPLCDFISQHMQITCFTIQLPRDPNHAIDKSKVSLPSQDGSWFWWPAAENLTGMLMERKIQRLRLAYTVTYLPGGEDEDLESYAAIDDLRTSQPREERDREEQECRDYREADRAGRPHKFDSIIDLLDHQLKRRQRLDFVVSREDDSVGDIGTVLVLTRPDRRSEEASAR